MLMPDVNILIYAHRADSSRHRPYHDWWNTAVNDGRPLALSALVAVGFVRIVTNPRFPGGSTPQAKALAFIDEILDQPQCRMLMPGPEHWQHCSRLLRATKAAGKLVADAQHAALAIEHGCHWVSADRDFMRFENQGLQLRLLEL